MECLSLFVLPVKQDNFSIKDRVNEWYYQLWFSRATTYILYEVQSDQNYFSLALKQHLVLVVDKKLKEPVLINVVTGDRKTGRVLL